VKTVNIQAAKTHLSRLVEEAAAGEEIVLAKAGKPVARLVPYGGAGKKRTLVSCPRNKRYFVAIKIGRQQGARRERVSIDT